MTKLTEATAAPVNTEDAADGLWVGKVTDKVLAEFPNEALYTCAAGTSPSGPVHFGNMRDIATSYAVMRELQARGKKARLILSWDDFDRFRKVPNGLPEDFKQHIGKPLTAVPDPLGEYKSYAERYQKQYEAALKDLGIELEYRYQTHEYNSGHYADKIAFVLQNREKANDILLQFMTDKANEEKGIDRDTWRRENWPISVYSRFSGTDATTVLSYDGGTKLTYRCKITGKEEQIDFKEIGIVKLQWKIDWPMRWGVEQVHFEPGGKDHMTPGSSYDVGIVVARELFGRKPPVAQMYEFVGIQGMQGKMSGSKGNVVTPSELLDIYTPELLKWLYMRRAPMQSFNLAFDTEVYRQYDEFDREIAAWRGGSNSPTRQKILEFSGVIKAGDEPLAFKQAVALGQITQWNPDKLIELAEKSGIAGSVDSAKARLPKARAWLEKYNPGEVIALRSELNAAYAAAMDDKRRGHIAALVKLLQGDTADIATLEEKVYAIPKDPALDDKAVKVVQRSFFKDVYNLLISRDAGPRLSTFLWAIDRGKALALLAL